MARSITDGSTNGSILVEKEQTKSHLGNTAHKFHDYVCSRHGFGDHNIGQHPAEKLKKITQHLESETGLPFRQMLV